MALLLVSLAVIGFTPNSLTILDGTKTSPPLINLFHAAAMSTWLLLLLTQTALVAKGRVDLHRVTGLASLVVAPIVIELMLLIAVRTFDPDAHGIGFALNQVRRIIIFAAFFVGHRVPTTGLRHARTMLLHCHNCHPGCCLFSHALAPVVWCRQYSSSSFLPASAGTAVTRIRSGDTWLSAQSELTRRRRVIDFDDSRRVSVVVVRREVRIFQ